MSHEIIIGVVCPIGTDRKKFKNLLKQYLESGTQGNKIAIHDIHLTDLIFDKEKEDYKKLSESFKIFLQMQICNKIRRDFSKGYLIKCAIKKIKNIRNDKKYKESTTNIFLVDQIKNLSELDILNFVYEKNYLQVTLFSSEEKRREALDRDLDKDKIQDDPGSENKIIIKKVKDEIMKIKNNKEKLPGVKEIYKEYKKKIEPNNAQNIMKKDFQENNDAYKKTGQQVAKLAHLSHYYFNMDLNESEIKSDIEKFMALLFGKYNDYPSNDEFGMALAFEASFRSNFPKLERQIGAAILSETGEVISAASIRAPSPSPETSKKDMEMIKDGYEEYKKKIEKWKNDKKIDSDIKEYIINTLDFHPCTHAEISAILDSAKQAVSIRNATLYTTTYPCHICAKDIITAGIKRVVYLEAYPKSKNKDLYPKLIEEGHEKTEGKVNFEFFRGVGPRRYHFVYDKKNNGKEGINSDIPPLVKYRDHKCYSHEENFIINYFKRNEKPSWFDLMKPEGSNSNKTGKS